MQQKELSELTGISPSNIMSLYHSKTKYVYFDTVERICTALGIGIGDLFEVVPDDETNQQEKSQPQKWRYARKPLA